MSTFLSKKLTQWLIRKGAINTNERALYEYASFLVIYTSTPILVVLLIGFFLHISPVKCLIFSLSFIILKKYAGGFHFNSKYLCFIISTITELTFILLSEYNMSVTLLSVNAVFAVISLLIWSPVVSPQRSILNLNKKHSKTKVLRILIIMAIIIGILYTLSLKDYIPYIEYAIIMTALIQYPALIEKRFVHDHHLCN